MALDDRHDRHYMQARVREQIASGARYGRPFALLILEAAPSADGQHVRTKIQHALEALDGNLRPCDVIAPVFEDTLAVLLVETDAAGARDALFRIRARLSRQGGVWRVAMYGFPEQHEAIERLAFLVAA